jgi:hypothetical protein
MRLLKRLFHRRNRARPVRDVPGAVRASSPPPPPAPPASTAPPIPRSAPPPPPPPTTNRPRVQLLFEDGTVTDAPAHGPMEERIDYLARSLWPDSRS